jgi:hypothetical protein
VGAPRGLQMPVSPHHCCCSRCRCSRQMVARLNAAYVIMIAGANEISAAAVGLVYLCAVGPSLLCKARQVECAQTTEVQTVQQLFGCAALPAARPTGSITSDTQPASMLWRHSWQPATQQVWVTAGIEQVPALALPAFGPDERGAPAPCPFPFLACFPCDLCFRSFLQLRCPAAGAGSCWGLC